MCFDQPRIPKHRILKDHYSYNFYGRQRTSRRVILTRGAIVLFAAMGLLILAAEHSRASDPAACAALTPASQQHPSGARNSPLATTR